MSPARIFLEGSEGVTTACEVALLVGLVADDDDTSDYYVADDNQLELQTKKGLLRGELGEVTGVDAATTFSYALAAVDWVDVSLFVEDGDASVMISFNASGETAQLMFAPGEEIELGDGAYGYGCTGEAFESEFQSVGGRIEVEDSNEPDMVHLRVTLEFDGGDTVTGTVDVAIPPS